LLKLFENHEVNVMNTSLTLRQSVALIDCLSLQS